MSKMSSSSSSSSSSSGKYPQPIYMDYHVNFIPKLHQFSVPYWKSAVFNYVQANGLIGFIDGTIKPPPMTIKASETENVITEPGHEQEKVTENPDYMEWKKIDNQIQEVIMSTIQDEYLKEIHTYLIGKTAFEMWDFIDKNVFRLPMMVHPDRVSTTKVTGTQQNHTRYLPLYKAAVEGNVKTLDEILEKEPSAVRATITGASETALMVASRKKVNNSFVTKLIGLMTSDDLAMQNSFGRTAMFGAAMSGDVNVLKLMVEKNPTLPNIGDILSHIPLIYAAHARQKEAVHYLLQVTNEEFLKDPQRYLLHALISSKFFDISLSLLQRFPELAFSEFSPLESLTFKHSAFLSGANFSYWQRMIYSYLPSELESLENHFKSGDIENLGEEVIKGKRRRTNLSTLFWLFAGKFVPQIKNLQEKKAMHTQALQLLRFICFEIGKLDCKSVRDVVGHALSDAATMGNVEVVEEILTIFPNALYLTNEKKNTIFHIAIAYRKANVFNLIYQMTTPRHFLLASVDAYYNTSLHLAGFLMQGTEDQASLDLRSSGPGAALQLQRELQWFKEVEKLSWPQDQEARNFLGKTPATLFTESHEGLARQGEQWMKDRANSGIIIATLIATIVFGSAITVPGGSSSDTGLPLFWGRHAFLVFAVADALALFMSASSMLMFLGILTARYAVQDFLYSLPKRLIIALLTLFLSIIFMMIAFTAILYLVFGDEKRWVLSLVSSLASIPVLLFASLQFKPLLDIISSTYGPGIFGKQGDRIIT